MKHVILCALSDLKPYNGTPTKKNYTYKPVGFARIVEDYIGWYTNEAPIKLLIDNAAIQGHSIDHIIYICSQLCSTQVIPADKLAGCVTSDDYPNGITAEGYFRHVVESYLLQKGLDWASQDDFYCPIPYDTNGIEDSLKDIIKLIGRNAIVDVDTSGARRDAQLLLSHVIEFVQAGNGEEDDVSLGTSVYADLYSGQLVCQDDTYALSSLINAVYAFIQYGKAQPLDDYFSQANRGGQEVQNLCSSMTAFSDDLSLCRMAGIVECVEGVHAALESFESYVMDNASDATLGERLLGSFVPTIRDGFVPVPIAGDTASLIIEIIRWCVRRQMLQQALGLYREKAPEILVERGFVSKGDEILESSGEDEQIREDWINCILQLSSAEIGRPRANGPHAFYPDRCNEVAMALKSSWRALCDSSDLARGWNSRDKKKRLNRIARVAFPRYIADEAYVIVNPDMQDQLSANLVWFTLLCSIRNDTMHAKDTTAANQRKHLVEACSIAVKHTEGLLPLFDRAGESRERINALAHDIESALDALDGKVTLKLSDRLLSKPLANMFDLE